MFLGHLCTLKFDWIGGISNCIFVFNSSRQEHLMNE